MEKLGAFFAYVVVLAGIIIVLLVPWYIYANLQNFNPNIIATIAAALIGGFFALKGYSESKKREVAARHFSEKKIAYKNFTDMIFRLVQNAGTKNAVSQKDISKAIYNFRNEIIVWGDAETLRAYEGLSKGENPDADNGDTLISMDTLLRAIRKDLGHNDRKLKKGEIVKIFLNDEGKEELDSLTK